MVDIISALQAAAGAETGNPWDISEAVYNGSPINFLKLSDKDGNPDACFFKPDGTKFYFVGPLTDAVYEYNLSTAWEIGTASYSQSFSVSTQDTDPQGIFFKPDGLKMYIIGYQNDNVYEYDLSAAWDISTALFLQSFSVVSKELFSTGLFFKPDGLGMYTTGSASDNINQYTLSTAWDISSASFTRSLSVNTQIDSPQDVFFKYDGTKMYVTGIDSGSSPFPSIIVEYDLSTAWNVSTASFLQSFSTSAQESSPRGLFFKPDGLVFYIVGAGSGSVYEYDLSTAWDISTAVWPAPTNDYFSVTAQDTGPEGLFFKPDGLKMYVVGRTGDAVYEYDLSTAWDVSSASYLQNFSVSVKEVDPREVFFKPDGLKMYVLGRSGDDVNEYDLSTAWDVSSASYLQNFSVSSQETNPQGLFFKPDGLKMYVVGLGAAVYEYDLSTAWDISSASYLQNFSVSSQETSPQGVFFKPDGLKMYVVGRSGVAVYEYDLSTAWDVSSASYLQNFSVSAQEANPTGVFFKPNGLKMYVIGGNTDAVYSYDL